jgi:hypothetical protein
MSNVLRKIQRNGRDAGMLPGRTFERTQGCWNCIHFKSGEDAHRFFVKVCKPRDEAAMQSYIATGQPQAAEEMRQLLRLANKAIKTGGLGMCSKGKGAPDKNGKPSDFVAHNYLCDDGWTGAQGASIARAGAAPDKTADELKDIIDGSNQDGGEAAASEAGLIVKP